MKPVKTKSRTFLEFSLKLLGYKKWTTVANLFCNSIIFSHQAAVTYFIRQILNNFATNPADALRKAYPYLIGLPRHLRNIGLLHKMLHRIQTNTVLVKIGSLGI